MNYNFNLHLDIYMFVYIASYMYVVYVKYTVYSIYVCIYIYIHVLYTFSQFIATKQFVKKFEGFAYEMSSCSTSFKKLSLHLCVVHTYCKSIRNIFKLKAL